MQEPGARLTRNGAVFVVRAPDAQAVLLCLFDEGVERHVALMRDGPLWCAEVPGIRAGQLYGYRAEGEWAPEKGLWFDPTKLLVDPHATRLDRPFTYDPVLSAFGVDTAAIVPRAILEKPLEARAATPKFTAGGLIYELNVRGFTMLHPDVPEAQRGTIAALAHPSVISHFKKLGVTAVELMPIVAWIDERHLPPLGLANAWGYNPVVPMALDPRLAPGGIGELRETVQKLHRAGIGVILDLVFNHTGESDVHGPILSLRGLDNRTSYAHAADGGLINDTGTGNTLNCAEPATRQLILASLRHFVSAAGVDGFRFDLAPVMARGPGFDPAAPIFAEIAADPVLADRVMIAEPWDIGPGGYQLGCFPPNWLEWNDRYRDDVRRFWRGDGGIGPFITRLAGSSDVFGTHTRSVNFLAAHDGFTLADTVAFTQRHNEANGEENRDGHGENWSWNHGIEGTSDDADVQSARAADLRALLTTLFASSGTIMLTAGDEFGRTQRGNNNAYAQDNDLSWVDWAGRDLALEAFVATLSGARAKNLTVFEQFPEPGTWHRLDGMHMTIADWESSATMGVAYEAPLPDGRRFRLNIDRRLRSVFVDIVQK